MTLKPHQSKHIKLEGMIKEMTTYYSIVLGPS